MTKPTEGKQQSTDKTKEDLTLSEAARIVREAIEKAENHLRQVANSTESDPIMLEGSTSEGYDVQMMVDPAKIAKIMLDYGYPTCWILEEEPLEGMWDEMARMVGLDSVFAVGLRP